MSAGPETERLCALWRDQRDDAGEPQKEVRMIAARIENLRRLVFWRNAVEYVAAMFVLAMFGAMMLDDRFLAVMRVGAALCVAGTLYVIVQLYRRTTIRRRTADLERPCIAFHRRELERQRDALASVARWYLAPFVPGLVTFFVGVPLVTGTGWMIGFGSLAAAAILYFAIARMNGAAAERLQHEIDALDVAAPR